MKKKGLFIMMLTLVILVVAGCSGNAVQNEQNTANGENKQKPVTLKIYNNKVEIVTQLEKMKSVFEAENPGILLKIETVGGGADYNGTLKAKFASGEAPDIFANKGDAEAIAWKDSLLDLSGQPWVDRMLPGTKDSITLDGKIYGMPISIEGYGYIYNKDIFKKAGITKLPSTISELAEMAEKLKQQGINTFSNGYMEFWILGNHLMNAAIAKQENPAQFMNDWLNGKVTAKGNAIFEDWVKLLDLTVKYGQSNPITTDYNTQVTLFTQGKTATLQQGNWVQPTLDKLNPNLNIGFMPMPINDDPKLNDRIFTGVPLYWVVNKDSANKEAAKKFLNWLVSSDTGKKYMVKELKIIPAFKDIPYSESDLGPLAASIKEYTSQNKTLGWYFSREPVGANKEFAAAIQSYVAGKSNKDQMLQKFDDIIKNLTKK